MNGKLIWNNESSFQLFKIRNELKEYENLKLFFGEQKLLNKTEKPLISIIITLFNQENYIKYIYSSILKQELKDIEIIFVNDASQDNSEKIIKQLMKFDKRIIYLKNDINKRAFYSRYKGILNSKGKYILVVDPDDLLINNILIKAFGVAEKYNLDIVQFYIISGYDYNGKFFLNTHYKYINGFIKGNLEIRKLFYFGVSRNLWDKLVKREIYLKSIRFMRREFYNENYFINDDDTAYFGLIHVAESYGFLEQIGYFYKSKSKTKEMQIKRANRIYESFCNIMKYFYMQSDNNILEKRNICFKYFRKSIRSFGNLINYLTEGFDYIIDILNLYQFIFKKLKKYDFKRIFNNRK